jgi:LDH2 family malate/lactate/ureidoglycolate dehydrogenase
MDHLTERCQANTPLREGVPVRMPGEQAERSIAAARAHGVPLAQDIVRRLGNAADRFGLALPAAG